MEEVLREIQLLKEQLGILGIQNKKVLNCDEAARYLGISKSYIYNMCQKNEIPHYRSKGGKIIYFRREDIEEWMTWYKVSTNKEIADKAISRTA